MIFQGQVGPIITTTALSDGSTPAVRMGKTGEIIASELHAKYYEATYRRNKFSIANQAAVALTANFATIFTGLAIGNPVGSGYNMVIDKFGYAQTVAVPTATAIGLMTGIGALTASLTPRNGYVGGAAGVALATGGQTLPATPVLERVIASAGTLATTGFSAGPPTLIDLDGSIILPPGTFLATYSTVANTAAWLFSFSWEEVPI